MSTRRRVADAVFGAAERGWVPDPLTRAGIRRLARGRLRRVGRGPALDEASLRRGAIAPAPAAANEQHYEVPADFFGLVLGPWRKYSCGLWSEGTRSLADAESAMLCASAESADLRDGQRVLDLGCGWGAFSLFAAERFPNSRFLAVSNSGSQGAFIEKAASQRDLANVEVLTADVNRLELPAEAFDRIVSIEMFEHMGNYEELMRRVGAWLPPGGKLFVHVFCHRAHAYRFSTEGAGDWMAREFFTGGLMPSFDLLPRFAGPLELEERSFYRGTHYQRTAEAWLARLDSRRAEATALFGRTDGPREAAARVERWRLFFLACAETFGLDGGREWGVGHYRFVKPERLGGAEPAGPGASA